ncbi:MAG: hypothetical protein H6822_05900 [Planctomycetaceae bacterium]|nr:hypothetical protein [Planctomycetales bacterium]MCB9921693.1 hypothetical protein [Planctomycetaceae bacterium]
MRLTLRTMLAYLDDVLDPADALELEQKIEESSFASGLVHRVRDSMRRMRLGAPKLDGRGLGLDPNTVADYLDSTLAPERVPEFEKVCLESDVHLAEVASCHQILTLVLGEPAEVDSAMRERAYRIGHADNRQPKAAGNGAASTKSQVAPSGSDANLQPAVTPAKAQRPSQLSTKSLAITMLLGFLVAVIALQSVGVERLRGLIGMSSRQVVESTSPVVTPDPETERPSPPPKEVETKTSTEPAATALRPGDTSSEVTESPVESRPVASEELDTTTAPSAMNSANSAVVARPTHGGNELPPRMDVAPPIEEGAGKVEPTEKKNVDEVGAVAPIEPAKHLPIGRYISEEQVLARFDETAGDWFRIEPDSPLVSGQRFIVLPTYRPQLLLTPDIKVTLAGESHLRLGQTTDEGAPVLGIESGRAIVVPLGEPEAAVRLETAVHAGTISFADADSVLAIDVMKYLPPGQSPELEPAIEIIQIFALSGQLVWSEEGSGSEMMIIGGQVLTMDGEGKPGLFEIDEVPGWITGKDLADIDRLASTELRRDLAAERPLSLSLLERTEFRQVEVRSLACRSLCSLDMFDSAINALDGPGLRSYWYAQFDAIRHAMSRNPQSAAKLQRALEKLTGDDAGLMYELLCGFSPEQLAAGGAKELVDALEHERVSVRVLAYENLRRITDKTQLFRPEQPPAQQKGEVMKWRRNLEAGGIVYLHVPNPLPSRRAVIASADEATPSSE